MESDDWIQESLARLEGLEEERSRVESSLEDATDPEEMRRLGQRLDQLDADIRLLYQRLEEAADDEGEAADEPQTGDFVPASGEDEFDSDAPTGLFSRDDMARMAAEQAAQPPAPVQAAPPAPVQAAPPAPVQAAPPAPVQAAPPAQAGFGAPAQAGFGAPAQAGFGAPAQAGFGAPAQAGFGAPAQAGFGAPAQGGFSAPAQPSFGGGLGQDLGADLSDLDDAPKGKGKLIGIIVAILVIGGVGGYFALAGKDDPAPDTSQQGPVKVISAGEVPPDTQGPKGAKGTNVDSVEGSHFKEGRPSAGGSRPSSGGSSSTPKKKKDDGKTKIIETDDPLAGIDGK